MKTFTIICQECGGKNAFVEVGHDNYVVIACPDCQHQEETFPDNDLGIKYKRSD